MGTLQQGIQQSLTGKSKLNAVVQPPIKLNPKSAVVPENITKVHKIVLGDCKLKLREIADTLKISESSVFTILHESFGMRKLFSKWLPRFLTLRQKKSVGDSERYLELFKRGKKDFLRQYVIMDET